MALEDLTIPSFDPFSLEDDTSKVPHVSHSAICHFIAKSHSIIPFLTLPSLETLTLDLRAHTAPEATLNVHHLICRLDCSLTELNLHGITPGKEVVELLRCTPKLTQLAFHYRYSQWKHNVNEDFINLFEVVDMLLQKLQSFSITIGWQSGKINVSCLDSEAFIGMIESQWWVHQKEEQLQAFKFIANTIVMPGPSLGTIKQLQAFKEKGMCISIQAKMADLGQEITYV